MRTILFRGKRTDNGEWWCGCLLYDEESDRAFIAKYFEDMAAYLREVASETVGQYTGRTDRNDKPIFEGDIVTGLFFHALPVTAVVTFQDGAFGLEWYRGGDLKTFYAFTSICNVEYEVIGNIHDNPELMKGEKE